MSKQQFNSSNSCQGKHPYLSLAKASKAAAIQTNNGNVKIRMEAYKCPFCLKYHFGHTKKKKERTGNAKVHRQKAKLDPKDYDVHTGLNQGYCTIRKTA